MNDARQTRELVLKYFHSWRDPADFDAFRSCLADDVVFDNGRAVVAGAGELTRRLRSTEAPWTDVVLQASMFDEAEAALFYEATDKATGGRVLVAEHLSVAGGRITQIRAAVSPATARPRG